MNHSTQILDSLTLFLKSRNKGNNSATNPSISVSLADVIVNVTTGHISLSGKSKEKYTKWKFSGYKSIGVAKLEYLRAASFIEQLKTINFDTNSPLIDATKKLVEYYAYFVKNERYNKVIAIWQAEFPDATIKEINGLNVVFVSDDYDFHTDSYRAGLASVLQSDQDGGLATQGRPNIPILGLTGLASCNPDTPSLAKYGRFGSERYYLSQKNINDAQAVLTNICKTGLCKRVGLPKKNNLGNDVKTFDSPYLCAYVEKKENTFIVEDFFKFPISEPELSEIYDDADKATHGEQAIKTSRGSISKPVNTGDAITNYDITLFGINKRGIAHAYLSFIHPYSVAEHERYRKNWVKANLKASNTIAVHQKVLSPFGYNSLMSPGDVIFCQSLIELFLNKIDPIELSMDVFSRNRRQLLLGLPEMKSGTKLALHFMSHCFYLRELNMEQNNLSTAFLTGRILRLISQMHQEYHWIKHNQKTSVTMGGQFLSKVSQDMNLSAVLRRFGPIEDWIQKLDYNKKTAYVKNTHKIFRETVAIASNQPCIYSKQAAHDLTMGYYAAFNTKP